ncbi:MAG: hypothetical protein V7638_839 [Acidobacteriota bacterium]
MKFPKAALKKEWVLTKEAFDHFLTTLDGDRDTAGQKYEDIRRKLLKYFQWRGSDAPDIDADETLNRAARRIAEGAHVYNLNGYIYGVARLVHAESLTRRKRRQEFDEQSLVEFPSITVDDEAAQWQKCLERCLGYLNEEDREVITEYYRYDKAEKIICRRRLAARLGISPNALRVKMHRQRLNLEACVEECLGRND